jgi:hypothetical protein
MDHIPSISEPATYRICVLGRVTNGWSDFMSKPEESVAQKDNISMTVITGTVPDQSALFGMLCRIRDLGLVLYRVEYLPNF